MALNHIQITNAKPRDKAYKVADSDGLYAIATARADRDARHATAESGLGDLCAGGCRHGY